MTDTLAVDFHVPETVIGKWFLRSDTWINQVLERALCDLDRLIIDRKDKYSVVVDVGCGYGHSLEKLWNRFSPDTLIAVDIDQEMVDEARARTSGLDINTEFVCCPSSEIRLPDNSVDLLFCHQTFHHMVLQEKAMENFYRVLKPGGILLFAESTKRYISSWVIRMFFRHPMEVQKTADEYLSMISDKGFTIPAESISYPFLWWSREDLGVLENWFGIKPPQKREETLINLAAIK